MKHKNKYRLGCYSKIDAMWIYSDSGEPVCNLMAWRIEAKKVTDKLAMRQIIGSDYSSFDIDAKKYSKKLKFANMVRH